MLFIFPFKINKKSWRLQQVQNKRKSSIQINQNMLNYFRRDSTNTKKLLTLNDKKNEKMNNSLYEDCKIEYEKKNKAKRCLLFLLNKKSNGTFCPQIIDYFKKVKESKSKNKDKNKKSKEANELNQLNEIKEEDNYIITKNLNINNEEDDLYINLPKMKNSKIERQVEMNYIKQIKNLENNKRENINEENDIINQNNQLNHDSKDAKVIENNEMPSLNSIENKNNNLNTTVSQEKNIDIINQEKISVNKIEALGVSLNGKKAKKNSKKKAIKKGNKIDIIYNLQRSELQKYGNYHSSLRSAIQNNIWKKK